MKDITGQKFGRLTAVRFIDRDSKRTLWEFKCECGTIKSIRLDSVKTGKVISCGCALKEQAIINGRFNRFKNGRIPKTKGFSSYNYLADETSIANKDNTQVNSQENEPIRKVCDDSQKPVVRMDKNGNVIQIHKNIAEAAEAIGRSPSGVGGVCRHYVDNKGTERRSCAGYRFLFLDEFLEQRGLK